MIEGKNVYLIQQPIEWKMLCVILNWSLLFHFYYYNFFHMYDVNKSYPELGTLNSKGVSSG